MSDYRLQTEVSDEVRREISLHEEKRVLLEEIREQELKISKSFFASTKIFSLLIVVNVLLSLIWQRPADFFVVIVYGVGYAAEIVWLMFGLRKQRRKFEEWESIAGEREIQNYSYQ